MREVNWNNVKREAPKWFRDAKFGLFFTGDHIAFRHIKTSGIPEICTAKAWSRTSIMRKPMEVFNDFGYKDFMICSKEKKFDPDQWASLVKRSGAKYAGAVSEHADNFFHVGQRS